MSNTNTRRDFFKNFKKTDKVKSQPKNIDSDDPLFNKYAKQKAGRVISKNARKSLNNKGLSEYIGAWTFAEANHLLRRLQYGVKYADVNTAITKTMSQVVDELFTFSTTVVNPSPAPLNNYQTAPDATNPRVDTVALGEPWPTVQFTTSTTEINNLAGSRRSSMVRWMFGVMLDEYANARNKMTDFWLHFIPTDSTVINIGGPNYPTFYHEYIKLMRENCIGNFKTLIELVTKSPSMLMYLGNHLSTATLPNENYARELLELFTIGKDLVSQDNNNYTEEDIRSAAKVLSGWRVTAGYSATYPIVGAFASANHNQTNKVFSAKFSNNTTGTTINNQTGANGANEFAQFFNLLFTAQAVKISEYVAERLYRYFVYYEIDAFTKTNIIEVLAKTLRDNNWDVLPMVKQLFKSEHFYDMVNRGVMIKSPFDLITSVIKNFNMNTTKAGGNTATGVVDQYNNWVQLLNLSNNMEQLMGGFPTVSGYKAYYQQPFYYQSWINANSLQRREAFINNMITGATYGNILMRLDFVSFIKQFPSNIQSDPNLMIDECVKFLLPQNISTAFKNDVLKKANLLNNQTQDYYWTDIWAAHLAAPTDATKLRTVTDRLKAMFTTILKLAEYQLH
jgi:uncharacterized protein (DUF1800 family)